MMNKSIYFFLSVSFLILLSCKGDSTRGGTSTKSEPLDSTGRTHQPIEPLDFQTPFLKRYEGMIDGELEFEMILYNDGNGSLSGWYQYTKIKKTIHLSGEVDLDESFILEEYTGSRATGKFIGEGSDISKIKGKWLAAGGGQERTFEMSAVESSGDEAGWTGTWYLNDVWDGGVLIIGNVTKDSMDFSLNIVRNAHIGSILGRAAVRGGKGKYKKQLYEGDESCELNFSHRKDYIQLEQKSSPWACEFGMRAYAGGRYDAESKVLEATIPFGDEKFFRTQAEHDAFKTWVGEEIYQLFAFNMQHSELEEVEDGSQTLLKGWVYGLMPTNQSILVRRGNGALYAATPDYRDMEQSIIHYYSSTPQTVDTMITPIRIWSKEMDDYQVVYHYPDKGE